MALSVSYRCSVLFSVDQKLLLGTGCDPPLLGLFEKAAAASASPLFSSTETLDRETQPV